MRRLRCWSQRDLVLENFKDAAANPAGAAKLLYPFEAVMQSFTPR
jgi:hypothetical protein